MFILNFATEGSQKLKRLQIDNFVLDKFKETRKKRLPVKDDTLQQWGMEINDTVKHRAIVEIYFQFFYTL